MAKQRQNYFDQTIRQHGDDFIMFLKADDIQKAAKRRIFREMIKGEIDYSVYGKYFTDPKFFENLLIAAHDELQNNAIIANALTEFDINHPGNNLVIVLRGKHSNLAYVYQVLYNTLYQMKFNNYNVGFLSNIPALLYQYRNIL